MVFNPAVDLQASLLSAGITSLESDFMPGSLNQQGHWNWVMHLLPRIIELVVSIPIRIIFIRMAASRLAVDDQSIICLDRSVRGNNVLGIIDAWETFDKTDSSSEGLGNLHNIIRYKYGNLPTWRDAFSRFP